METYYDRMTKNRRRHEAAANALLDDFEKDSNPAKLLDWIGTLLNTQGRAAAQDAEGVLNLCIGQRVSRQIEDRHDLGAYLKHPLVQAYGYFGASMTDSEAVSTVVRVGFHLASHEYAGNRVYTLAPGLAHELLDTQLRGLHTDSLRLPFESISVLFPPGLGLKVWNKLTGYHELLEVMVTEDRSNPGVRSWWCCFIGAGKRSAFDDALFYFAVHLRDGASLDDALDETQRALDNSRYMDAIGRERCGWRDLFRLLMNTVIYATWPDAEVEHVLNNREARLLHDRIAKLPKGEKRSRLQAEYRKLDPRPRMILGRHVIYVSREQAAAEDEAEARRTGKPLVYRIRVAGHWKQQVYGPQHSLRRPQWIWPYWRGPDDGVMREAVHKLGTGNTR